MFLKYAFQGTRDNQLFLTNSVFQKIDDFKPIYDWFKNSLVLIAPDERFSQFENFIDEKHPLYFIMNEILPQMDTGIKHLGSEEVQFENLLISREFKNKLQEELKEGASVRFVLKSTNDRIVVTRKNEKLIAKKLVSYHSKPEGKEAKFEIGQESDGTLRIIDLLPALLDASNPKNKKVYVIDEVDRSLHTILTKQLIESYLSSCSTETRSQLLITTHDVLLMDQNLLRRDEMWVAERNDSGISILFSFIDYKDVRYDKDIRKSYLQGRLGGTPKILLKNSFQKNGVTC
ncbi:MAG: ATP-binding protein [Candidatus Delongbacteria bacterium]|nr:ATP-binding protein [Candidatus Delongbacteria bacterium]